MEVSGQIDAPALPPEESAPGTHYIGGRVDPRAGLDTAVERIFFAMWGVEPRSFSL
jgi:hypothetical protein